MWRGGYGVLEGSGSLGCLDGGWGPGGAGCLLLHSGKQIEHKIVYLLSVQVCSGSSSVRISGVALWTVHVGRCFTDMVLTVRPAVLLLTLLRLRLCHLCVEVRIQINSGNRLI